MQAVKNYEVIRTEEILPRGNFPNFGLDLATAWFSKCQSEHPLCASLTAESFFVPTRLVDVFPNGKSNSDSHWSIVDGKKETVVKGYLTLSHCWGKVENLKLTKDNVSQLQAGLPDSSLPPKYKDAVAITRTLGYRHIWIDSLCIIQDSQEDWQREGLTMHDVYKHSRCTLAASTAANSEERILRQRSPTVSLAEVVQLNWIEDSTNKSFWQSARRTGDQSYLIYHHNFLRMTLKSSVLAQRAWCFQELVLSPRILRFEEEQLFWECRTLKSCEAHPFITMKTIWDVAEPVISDMFRGMLNEQIPRFWSMRPSSHWHTILESYTKGSLTRSEDKLVAIAGVAKAHQELFGGDYLAGLWRDELPYTLLWSVQSSKASKGKEVQYVARVKPYRAPSWSWASVDGCIKYVMVSKKAEGSQVLPVGHWSVDLAFVSDAKVSTLSNNTFGQVTGGYIELIGVLVRATEATTLAGITSKDRNIEESFPRTDREEYTLEMDPTTSLQAVYYLPIVFSQGWMYGLTLKALGTDALGRNEYARIGTLMFGKESFALLGIPEAPASNLSNWPGPNLQLQTVRLV
jgi:hypothetical protein